MFAYTKLMQAMASAGVVSATDPYFNLTTLLLNTTATNGAQNNTFLDSSTNNFSITRNGNTTQGTFTPFSQTGWSNFFDGTAATYLAITSNTAFAWGTGAYTVEGWIFQTARSTNEALFFGSGGSSGAFLAYITNTGAVKIENFGGGALVTGTAGDIPLNTWCHVAYVRSSTGTNDTNIYVNGVVKATGTDATNWTNSAAPVIGMLTANTDYAIKGYVSNFRINKGTAVYTAAFTPSTTPLTAISGTSVLTCQSNRFVDNSSNAFTITPTGAMAVQAFSPFLPTDAYSTSVVGGSGYFDGTGDYLGGIPSTVYDFTTLEDFSIEFWTYLTSVPSSFGFTGGNASSAFGFVYDTGAGYLKIQKAAVSNVLTTTYVLLPNQWYHIVGCRQSGTLSIFVNGVRQATVADTTSFASTDGFVGGNTGFAAVTGYISNFRILTGNSAYNPSSTTLTIPTAPVTAITNTAVLLSCTNAGIFDSAAKNVYETFNTAAVSTAQAKWGTTSMAFNGTTDYIVNPSNALVSAWGSGDFTVEGWWYANNLNGGPPLWTNSTSHSDDGNSVYLYANGSVGYGKVGTNEIASTTGVFVINVWNHVAVVRSGATVYLYVNGVSVASGAAATYVNQTAIAPITIGRQYQNSPTYYNGYVDDFRVTKGYARYPSGTTFTPPIEAFPLQ
jgi:hypothetical protein